MTGDKKKSKKNKNENRRDGGKKGGKRKRELWGQDRAEDKRTKASLRQGEKSEFA